GIRDLIVTGVQTCALPISRGPDGPPMRVVLGGTFDILHKGHEALLRAAFEGRPEQVLIGLTTDRFARESRTRVNPYAVRERNLRSEERRVGKEGRSGWCEE